MNLICSVCGGDTFTDMGPLGKRRVLRCRACGADHIREAQEEVYEPVYVSKVTLDLTLAGMDQETADKVTENIREFILARMDDYYYEPFDFTSGEEEINWSAETSKAFDPEGK